MEDGVESGILATLVNGKEGTKELSVNGEEEWSVNGERNGV